MKALNLLATAALCMCSSCVLNETIETLDAENQQDWLNTIVQTLVTDNVLIISDNRIQFMGINWNENDFSSINEVIKKPKNACVYAYKGEGGRFVSVDDRPGLEYKQKNEWPDAEFQYAVKNSSDTQNGDTGLNWQEAFGHLSIQISNKEKGLHLQVNGVQLRNVKTEGTFLFPGEEPAKWSYNNDSGILSYYADTLNISDKTVSFLGEGGGPVMPQEREAWWPKRNPELSSGAYLLLSCRIFKVCDTEVGYQKGVDYPIWCDSEGGFSEVAIPVNVKVTAGETTHLNLVLESGCEWYSINGESPQKILQPITFKPSVDDWINDGFQYIEVD